MLKEDANELIERMLYVRTIKAVNDNTRLSAYEAALLSDDPEEWISAVKTAHLRSEQFKEKGRSLNRQESELCAKIKEKLEGLLAEALSINQNEVEGYINKYLAETL